MVMFVTADTLRDRLRLVEDRLRAYNKKAESNGGKLKQHEVWRHDYLSFPYLIGAPNDRLEQRFRDVFMNVVELTSDAGIAPLPVKGDDSFMQKFTHLLEEYGLRNGGPPIDVISEARKPIAAYFANGEPIAVRMFRNYAPPLSRFMVKYGPREFLEPMLQTGRVRICPASYYNDMRHNAAVRDDEIRRTFYIPTFQERFRGIHHLDFQGHRIAFNDDDIVLPVVMPDYFLYSLCDNVHYRMPSDFRANSAIIIRNPDLFAQRIISSFLARWPDWEPKYGLVTYYDPYLDYTKIRVPEMAKHFGYSYQREVRIVMRAKHRPHFMLQPEFLDIGDMTDYADLVCV